MGSLTGRYVVVPWSNPSAGRLRRPMDLAVSGSKQPRGCINAYGEKCPDRERLVAQRLRIPRIPAWSTAPVQKRFVEVLGDLHE